MLNTTMYPYLSKILKEFDGNYLEIGVFDGEGIASLAKEFPNKSFYGVDPFIEDGYTAGLSGSEKGNSMTVIEERALKSIESTPNVRLIKMTSKEFSSNTELISDIISVVYIDGSHWYDDVIIDSDLAVKLIGDKPGLIAFDDILLEEVGQALKDFLIKYQHIIKKVVPVYIDADGKILMTSVYIN